MDRACLADLCNGLANGAQMTNLYKRLQNCREIADIEDAELGRLVRRMPLGMELSRTTPEESKTNATWSVSIETSGDGRSWDYFYGNSAREALKKALGERLQLQKKPYARH